MLTTSAASSTSRRTMTAVASTVIPGRLLCDDAASGGFFVELADELVSSRLERPHRQGRFALAGNDFFQLEVMAFEFFGGRIEIFNKKLETLARRDLKLRGFEPVILDGQRERQVLRIGGRPGEQQNPHVIRPIQGVGHGPLSRQEMERE